MDDQTGSFDVVESVTDGKGKSEPEHVSEGQLLHLRDDIRPLAALPDAKRIELIRRGIVIEHPAFARALNEVSWLLTHPGGNIGRGMLLLGDSGLGKTTFGKFVCDVYGTDEQKGRIVMFDASGARTTREVYGRILQSLDGPAARNMHGPDREQAVVRLFRALEVRALIVDEVQDIAKGSEREQQRVLDGIKHVMNTARVPLIGLGAPESERALVTDRHLAQRLSVHRLEPWRVDQEFLDLMSTVTESLPLRKPSQIRTERALKYLIEETGGSLRRIMDLLTKAAVRAIQTGRECLTLESLQEVAIASPRMGELGDAA